MKQESIEFYRCPTCSTAKLKLGGAELTLENREVIGGWLCCAGCGREFQIKNAIPRFVTGDNYASSFGFQWDTHRKTQLDSYSGLTISHDRVFAVSGWPKKLKGQRILEAGSGAGRFTEILQSTGAEVYSFDFSNSIEANFKNNGHFPNVQFFQGDIFSVPFPNGFFDKVFCLGVIQHTPDPEKAFFSLATKVRPGGELVVDVYEKKLWSLVQWKYLLRPLTTRLDRHRLYEFVKVSVDLLLPLAIWLRRNGGRIGARLVPILEYSHLDLPPQLNREWSILDTFDMYAPVHDHPQRLAKVRNWFERCGFEKIDVRRGPNGVVGKGVRASGTPG